MFAQGMSSDLMSQWAAATLSELVLCSCCVGVCSSMFEDSGVILVEMLFGVSEKSSEGFRQVITSVPFGCINYWILSCACVL